MANRRNRNPWKNKAIRPKLKENTNVPHSRDKVRVGEKERDAPSDGLATPNSMGTPSGMPALLSSPPLVWPLPLRLGELVRRAGVTLTGSGIKDSVPPAAVIAASLSKDEVRRALVRVGVEVGVVKSLGEDMEIGIGMAEGDIKGEKLRCWGVLVRESFSKVEARSSRFLEVCRPTSRSSHITITPRIALEKVDIPESTLPAGLGARYEERDDGRETDFGTATEAISPRKKI